MTREKGRLWDGTLTELQASGKGGVRGQESVTFWSEGKNGKQY